MNCDAALPMLYELVDGDIGREDAIGLALHLGSCRDCSSKLEAIRRAENFYAANMFLEAPPGLDRRIADSVARQDLGRSSDRKGVGLAAAVAAACAGIALAIESGAPGSVTGNVSRVTAGALQALASLRLDALLHGFSLFWSEFAAKFFTPPPLRSSLAVAAALLALQIGGSTLLLVSRSREGDR